MPIHAAQHTAPWLSLWLLLPRPGSAQRHPTPPSPTTELLSLDHSVAASPTSEAGAELASCAAVSVYRWSK